MNKKKLTILHTEASKGWGGQEVRILREAVGMRKRGHTVIIAAHPESNLLKHLEKEGFRTISITFKRRNFIHIIYFLKRFIEKEHIHIVNTHSSKDSWLGLPAARIAGNRPLVLRTRHLSTSIHDGILNKFLYDRLPDFVITTGETIRKQMIEVNRFNPGRIVSIPTGVDTDIFNPAGTHTDIREELNMALSTPLIGAVSVMRSWKGLDYLVKAMPLILHEIPEARFILAGEGIHRKTLEKTIEETGVGNKVYLLGHRDDVSNIMYSLDIIVHPSYANEGVPQTILQAMTMGKPVVASDFAPLKEVVIENETGILVPKKDPAAIASAVIRLLRNKDLSKKLGINGRNLALESYSLNSMLDKLETLYQKSRP